MLHLCEGILDGADEMSSSCYRDITSFCRVSSFLNRFRLSFLSSVVDVQFDSHWNPHWNRHWSRRLTTALDQNKRDAEMSVKKEWNPPELVVKVFLVVGLLTTSIFITRTVVLATLEDDTADDWSPEAQWCLVIPWEDSNLQGHVVSSVQSRYDLVAGALTNMSIQPRQFVPRYISNGPVQWPMVESDRAFKGKDWETVSKKMAFLQLLFEFVSDREASINSWRFFFEDDMLLHPALEPRAAREAINAGMKLSNGDGVMFLGLCGPHECVPTGKYLHQGLKASQCNTQCSHAFGFTQWKAAGFLSVLTDLQQPADYDSTRPLTFDDLIHAYVAKVHMVWALGSNLNHPAFAPDSNHTGIFYQDQRVRTQS